MKLRKIWIFARGWGVVLRVVAVSDCVAWFLGITRTSYIVLSILLIDYPEARGVAKGPEVFTIRP